MTRTELYQQLKEIQRLAWRDDDLMSQGTLFDLQDRLCGLVLKVATDCGQQEDLVRSFPFLYHYSGEDGRL